MKKQTVPVSAFSFTDTDSFAKIDKEGNVEIVSYSGKPFKHWYWGNFAIDLSGADFPRKFFPILEQHDVTRKIGFSTKPSIENNQLSIKNISFLNTEEALAFQDNSKSGFPYQASIQGRPFSVESVEDGESVEVNGHKLVGPGAIWRKWTYMETSVCVFGADPNTKSKALTDENEGLEIDFFKASIEEDSGLNIIKEVKIVDIKELKEQDPNGYESILQEAKKLVKDEVEKEFKDKEQTLTVKLSEMGKELGDNSKKLEEYSSKILAFEKAEVIRAEKEIKLDADSIWNEKLSDSKVPERLFTKVKVHVPYESFVKEGIFDKAAFTKAVLDEISDWEKEGVSTEVLGKGTNQKEVDEFTKSVEEDDAWVESMRKLSGQITINTTQ